ncbi:MAG: DUF58 domain-containing protein [Polyangiaceae bacterium]
MQVHPTQSAVHLSIAGSLTCALGVALGSGAVVAWGGALLVGLAIARAVTEVSVARIRAAGFEMLWRDPSRVRRLGRGEVLRIEAELRNRDARAARFAMLRGVASPELSVSVEPSEGEVPAGGRLRVAIDVVARRVGYHALHGLSLELRAGPGLFEIPLTFANPFGVEVLPRPYTRLLRSARGGRSFRAAEQTRSKPRSGESPELRELRQHQAGDPFRRIAWKASARRGQLLVREHEREEHEIVFLLVDAAVELGAGKIGESAFDRSLDEAASVAMRHLARGDRVGLGVLGARVLAWIPPGRGASHGLKLLEALAHAPSPLHADRSALDEAEVALRVLEHMRPLDPELVGNVGPYEVDRIARRADQLRPRAPFPNAAVSASSARELSLRSYLAAFGIGSPLRTGPERADVDEQLGQALTRLRTERPHPSLVYLWSPAPEPGTRERLVQLAARRRSRNSTLIWATVPTHAGIALRPDTAGAGARALSQRARLSAQQGERTLRRLGIHVERLSAEHEPGDPR